MSPAEQTYRLQVAAVQPDIDMYQRIAENPKREPDDRHIAGNEALRLRAELHRLRVEAANG